MKLADNRSQRSSMNPFVLPFDSVDATLTVAGGKGANLSRMARAGFPVPAGFLVSTTAYGAFVRANEFHAPIMALANDTTNSVEDASNAIRRTAQDLDSLDRIERHRNIAVVVPGLRVIEPNAVDEHQRLAEVGAANREVRLDASDAARTDINGRHQPERVGRAHRQACQLLARNDGHRSGDAAERHRGRGGRDDNGLTNGILCPR